MFFLCNPSPEKGEEIWGESHLAYGNVTLHLRTHIGTMIQDGNPTVQQL